VKTYVSLSPRVFDHKCGFFSNCSRGCVQINTSSW
jgi:hypothetical protein